MSANSIKIIPNNWGLAKLEDCIDILDSQRVPVNSKDRELRTGNIPYYGATGQVGLIDDYLFDEELILLGEDGAPFLDPTKKKAYLIRGKSWVNNHAHVLRAINGISLNPFICHYLNCFEYQGYVTGTTRLKLNQAPMRQIPIPLPPLLEQHHIVARIEELFSHLDAGVLALQRAKAQLQRYRQAVLKAAVEGRLTEEWRKAHPEVEPAGVLLERILRERRSKWEEKELSRMLLNHQHPRNDRWKQKYKSPKILLDQSDLPEQPTGWTYMLLNPILSIERSGMKTGPFGSLLKKEEHKTEGISVLGIENIECMKFIAGSKIHISEEKAIQLQDYDARPGDILISRSGTVGEVCVVPDDIVRAIISTNLMRVTLNLSALIPKYFCLLLNGSPFVMRQISDLCKGSTRAFLNQEILSTIIFPIAPIAEQRIIVDEVERYHSYIDQLEDEVNANLASTNRLRQSILKRAFEGKLVPQDPSDEPASMLLERIRTERTKETPRRGRKSNNSTHQMRLAQ